MSIKKIVTATIITLGFTAAAQAEKVVGEDQSIATELCVSAAAGNRAAMYNTIKSSGYSSKYVANKVECNGVSLLSFVENNGKNADSMLRMLDKRQTSVSITDLAKNTVEEK